MSPKEKAEELIEKFKPMFNIWDYYNDCQMDSKIVKENTIECINEVVDEIIKHNPNLPNEYSCTKSYWQQVKQELNKL